MNTLLLFDTDVLIDILRNNVTTIAQVKNYASTGLVHCACITLGEIYAGMKPKEEQGTNNLLAGIVKLPVTEQIAYEAGRLKYQTKSHVLWLDDCLIAATAIVHGCRLITKNVKHYPFRNLEIERIK